MYVKNNDITMSVMTSETAFITSNNNPVIFSKEFFDLFVDLVENVCRFRNQFPTDRFRLYTVIKEVEIRFEHDMIMIKDIFILSLKEIEKCIISLKMGTSVNVTNFRVLNRGK